MSIFLAQTKVLCGTAFAKITLANRDSLSGVLSKR
jgi:hypothetical protein